MIDALGSVITLRIRTGIIVCRGIISRERSSVIISHSLKVYSGDEVKIDGQFRLINRVNRHVDEMLELFYEGI